MQIKHVKQYYKTICEQRQELIENLRDLEKEANDGLMPPERLEEVKQSIQPLLQNYERISYIMFLLNQPQRQSKKRAYEIRNERFLSSLDKNNSLQQTIEENNKQLNAFQKH